MHALLPNRSIRNAHNNVNEAFDHFHQPPNTDKKSEFTRFMNHVQRTTNNENK